MADKEMIFHPFKYQQGVWDRLLKIIDSNRIGSAYLFSGPEGAAKEALALSFAGALNCQGETSLCGQCSSCKRFSSLQHEHLHIITPLPRTKDSVDKTTDVLRIIGPKNEELLIELMGSKGKDPFIKIRLPRSSRILINSIRELRQKLFLKSVEKGFKIVLIFDAHYLSMGSGESANALLKILEEPPGKTTLILVTDHKSLLLPTIQSRCQQIDFPPLSDEVIKSDLESNGISPEKSSFYAILADGNIQRARFLKERPVEDIFLEMKHQVESIINPDSDTWRKYIQSMSRLAHSDPGEFKFKLFLVQTWLLQMYRLTQNLKAPLLENGFSDTADSFTESFPHADFSGMNSMIENTILSVEKNAYMPLKVTNMLIEIQHRLQGTH